MNVGVVERVPSEVMEWKIPDFLSYAYLFRCRRIESPRFSSAGCTWYLILYLGFATVEYLWIYLVREDEETDPKPVTYTLGLKKAGGIVEEVRRETDYTYTKDSYFVAGINLWKNDDLQERESQLLPSGALTITCRIEHRTPTPEEEARSRETKLVELETLSSDFSDLLSGDRMYDVTADVQGKEFRAHRIVLAARSSVFRAMYEHDTAEAKSGLLTIPDCDPDSFGDFLRYLYTGRMEEISFHTAYHLYATAEKYDVQRLKSFCADYLSQNLAVANVCNVAILSDRYGDDRLICSVQDFFNKNYHKILLTSQWNALSTNTPRLSNKLLKEMATAALKH